LEFANRLACIANGHQLGVSGRIVVRDYPVPATSQNVSITDHQGAEWPPRALPYAAASERKRLAHEGPITGIFNGHPSLPYLVLSHGKRS
jgi:hypothetical protein